MVRRWQFHKMAEDGSGNEFVLASDYDAALEDLLAKTVGEKNDRIEVLAAELAEKDALIAQMTRDLVNYPLDMENVASIRQLEAALTDAIQNCNIYKNDTDTGGMVARLILQCLEMERDSKL